MLKQVSVFLENRVGRLKAIMESLSKAQINIRAMTISEDDDDGTIRFIVNNPEKAHEVLSKDFTVQMTNVIGVTVPNKPGAFCDVVQILEKNNVNIKYLYPLIGCKHGNANILIRVNETEKVTDILTNAGVKLFTQEVLNEQD
jgi:hypothetical protein